MNDAMMKNKQKGNGQERKGTEPKVIQPAENIDTEHNWRPPQATAS